jgi:Uma2 family endonuclease
MHTAHAETLTISPEEYLQGENISAIRHEYIDGEIYAMAGGSDAHARISGNAFFLLKAHLRGSGCSPYLGEMKAKVSDDKYFYPDLMVTCDKADMNSNYAKSQPNLIIEVLSESTEAYDRGKKFEYYRQIDKLQEYVLINQSTFSIDIFRKNAQQRWELFHYSQAEDEVHLSSVDLRFKLLELYEDVNFELV